MGLTMRWSEPPTARRFTFDDFNTETRSTARFDAFTPVYLPLPSRPASLSASFPARRIRQRSLSFLSLDAMSVKPDWGSALLGAMFLLVGGIFLWQARAALVCHTPIYTRGPSWLDPWAAVIGGCFFTVVGLYAIGLGFYRRKKPDGDS